MKTNSLSARFAIACILIGININVQGAITDIAPAPLITSPTASVLPNVFFMLDDSGSMNWDYMPDKANDFSGNFGFPSAQCNGVYYDPTISYIPPVNSTGVSYANSSFTNAEKDGFNTAGINTDLSTSFQSNSSDIAQAAYYFDYIGAQTTPASKNYYNTASTFYTECNTDDTSATITVGNSGGTSTSISSITVNGVQILSGTTTASTSTTTVATNIAANITLAGYHATVSGSVVTIWPPSTAAATFTPVITKTGTLTTAATAFPAAPKFIRKLVTSTSGPSATDERTNFANWYSFYRTRMQMMKTSSGLAFKPIGTSFRVGFAAMNNNEGTDFVPLDVFDATQKSAWYAKLYGASTGSSTPLRRALSDVGKMYANKLLDGSSNRKFNTVTYADPLQYSCQQNFTLLTTDGFWNGTAGSKLDGTAVGNQDGNEVRPMYDGSLTSSTVTIPYTTVQQRQKVTTGAVTTNTWSKTTTAIGAVCSIGATVPASTTTAYLLDSGVSGIDNKIALGLSSTDPDPGNCYRLGSANAWICRGNGTANPVAGISYSSVTDTNGVPWYLVSSGSTLGGSCIHNEIIFSDTDYSKRKGACPGTGGVTGNIVSTTVYTQNENISGLTTTDISNYTANQQTTQTTINGVTGAVSALTPATLTYNFTNTVSVTSTGTATTTLGAWTTGTTTSVCTATASLPAAGTSTPAITATSSTAGTSATTVLSTVGPTAGTAITTVGAPSGGTSDTLADVAEYYYVTDLRTPALGNCTGALGNPICSTPAISGDPDPYNNVPSSGLDGASTQHMTTFTLGLGARGRMVFDSNYQTQTGTSYTPSDFYSVKQGLTASTSVCTWQTTGACIWPTPASDAIENIDDLWHTAVNGRGTYFSASNPTDLSIALTTALAGVSARTGAAAAATTSNAFVTQGDNFLFRSTFVTQQWYGELVRQQLDVGTGAVLSTLDWSAQAKLDANTSRTIYFSPSNTTIASFTHANLVAASLDSNFNAAHIATLSQFCASGATCLSAGDQTLAAGSNLVNFIRGDRSNEGDLTDNTKYYRQRLHLLGDIVNSESIYVQGALASFEDPGYSTFASSIQKTTVPPALPNGRQSMVYVGANDGMLHAFYAADGKVDSATGNIVTTGGTDVVGGAEAWAYIPTPVMTNLYKLADKTYGISPSHQYFVDASPVVADICLSSCTNSSAVWKTIVVGGLNAGGQGYYALDVTNPLSPRSLWQFTDDNMGYTYGNPKVVKLKDGRWVVLITSGYNNTLGDGKGHLYVVNAATGLLITDISTGIGDTGTPSGLARIDAPVTSPGVNATVIAAYGGDMLGNVWRFDVNGDIGASGFDAQLMTTLVDSSGNPQPITGKPLITLIGSDYVIYVGTGRYLGSSDLADTQQQSFYAMKDPFTLGTTASTAIYPSLRSLSSFVHQTQTTIACPTGSPASVCTQGENVIVSSNSTVNFSTNGGWYMDFPLAGERANTDPALTKGTLVINTNHPNASSCSVGGDSYQYQLDYKSGGSVSTSPSGIVGKKLLNELATRPVVACLSDGSCNTYSQGSGGGVPKQGDLWENNPGSGTARRTSWRELTE